MSTNRGYFGIGIESTKIKENVGTLWRSAYCLGASFIFTIGARYISERSDTVKAWRHIPLYEYSDTDQFLLNRPIHAGLIGIEITEDSLPLKNFAHPERAIYILGPEDGSISTEIIEHCEDVVKIDSRYCLNVAVAGSIVMYDRNIKA